MDAFPARYLALALAAFVPAGANALDVELVNQANFSTAIDSDGPSDGPFRLTPDGRYTLFRSHASNLLPGDTNHVADLFLYDADSGTLERVSLGDDDAQSNGPVGEMSALSDDGRFIVFESAATGLVATPTGGYRHVYLRDRAAGTTTLLTRLGNGAAAAGNSGNAQVSADGRYVVFDTSAALDAKDTNGVRDVYRLDRTTEQFALMSVSLDGRPGNADSVQPQISADGSSVLFTTFATNLIPYDTNGYGELLLSKPAAGTLQRVSVQADGSAILGMVFPPQSDALSADGRFVLVRTYLPLVTEDSNGAVDGYLYDSQNGSIQRVTLTANGAEIAGYTFVTGLSRDAARITMISNAADIVTGLPLGGSRVFLRELASGAVTHVTFRSGGEQSGDDASSAAASTDGTVVVAATFSGGFVSGDTNDMIDVIRQDGLSSPAQRLSAPLTGAATTGANHDSGLAPLGYAGSADARFIAFGSRASNLVVGDLNNTSDIFVRDRLLGTTERVSVHSNGTEGYCASYSPAISDDGRYVVFASCTRFDVTPQTLRFDIYIHDRTLHTTTLLSRTPQGTPGNSFSGSPSVSADGRYVAFYSCASDLVPDDLNAQCDAFVRDTVTGTTTLATPSISAGGADQPTYSAYISRDGRYVAYTTLASNLVADDTNNYEDVFVFDRETQTVERISVDSQELPAIGYSSFQSMTADGSQVLFSSTAANLDPQAPLVAIYLRDRNAGTTTLVSRTNGGAPLFSGGPAALSADGSRIAFVIAQQPPALAEYTYSILLLDRTASRVERVRTLDERFGLGGTLELLSNGSRLLLSSTDNSYVPDDANGHFSDVFLLDKLEDRLFGDGFESN